MAPITMDVHSGLLRAPASRALWNLPSAEPKGRSERNGIQNTSRNRRVIARENQGDQVGQTAHAHLVFQRARTLKHRDPRLVAPVVGPEKTSRCAVLSRDAASPMI